jgi:hypothetical protein
VYVSIVCDVVTQLKLTLEEVLRVEARVVVHLGYLRVDGLAGSLDRRSEGRGDGRGRRVRGVDLRLAAHARGRRAARVAGADGVNDLVEGERHGECEERRGGGGGRGKSSEGREQARLLEENSEYADSFIPLRYRRQYAWRNHGTCPSKL